MMNRRCAPCHAFFVDVRSATGHNVIITVIRAHLHIVHGLDVRVLTYIASTICCCKYNMLLQVEMNRALEREKEDLEELEQRNQQLHADKDDIDRKMRDLGALGDAVGEFEGKSAKSLSKLFAEVSKQVEKFGGSVNRKALDELKTFKVKQTQLKKRRMVCSLRLVSQTM